MKKIFKLLLVFSSALFVSCDEGLLEPFTPGAQTEDVAIRKTSDLQKLMNSAYANLTNREDMVFTSVFTDEAGIGFANGGQGTTTDFVFFLNASSTAPNSIWTSSYFTLSRANRVIKFADIIVPVDAVDAQLIARLKAEALTVRALCHIKIMSYFSPNPKDDNQLAGILADRVIESSETNLLRVTNGQFYSLIHSDLNQALTIFNGLSLPAANLYPNVTFYPNKNLAKALKARAYALKGDYTNAEIWADDVITTSGINLATAANYNNIFYTDNEAANTEVIFRLKRTLQNSSQATNLGNGWASVNSTASGSPFYEVSRSLFNVLNATPTDVRRSTIVHPTSTIDPNYATSLDYKTTDRLVLGKYRGTAAVGSCNSDFKLVRLSEMYFIKAEARTAAGDLTGAANAIKSVLDKRFPTAQTAPVYASPTDAWKGILNQRRVEFAFEGYRFIDLKRLGTLAGVGIDRDPADYSSSSINFPGGNPANLPLTSYKFALPIPQNELNANSSIQQNAGY